MYLVNFLAILLTTLIFVAFLIVVLLFTFPIKVAAVFNSEQHPDVHLMMSWLNPFIKGQITRQNGSMNLTVSLFNKRVWIKSLINKKDATIRLKRKNYTDYVNIARSLEMDNAKLAADYGFRDPSVTGILYGAIDFASQYINLKELYNNADFFTSISYFNVNAEAEINAAVSFMRFLRRGRPHLNTHALGGSR